MGYQERDYYRDDDGPQDPLGLRSLSATTKLIIVTVLVYLVDLFFGGDKHSIAEALMMHADVFTRPWECYQFLTSGFVHDTAKINHILFNMIGLWIFGKLLEDKLGGAAMTRFYLCAIVFSSIVWAVRHYFLLNQPNDASLGASGGVVALVIWFCLRNPHATMLDKVLLPIPAWVFGALYVLADVFGFELQKEPGKATAFDAHIAGAVFAAVVWALQINFGSGSIFDVPGRWLRKVGGWFKGRPNLRVHKESSYSDRNEDDDLIDEGDRILAKLSSQGDASLTAKERKTLDRYSRLMRDKQKNK